MSDIQHGLHSLQLSVATLGRELAEVRLQMIALKGQADAAASLLEQRLQNIESVVGLLKLR
ncbi:hypothetical protein ALQ95_03894 [Pseudomonas syringae pv. ribicola]|uniref:Uncharacterized protein n=1 Tax=Pseudomonas syringae pv. ribicola TaxID=55398 RepID=A0A3M2W7A9_PSESI|nr:hypothetical protein ALQ95_03894 [Pseudomonas syringae pv. ribicola]